MFKRDTQQIREMVVSRGDEHFIRLVAIIHG
jgi:hypothetical protein